MSVYRWWTTDLITGRLTADWLPLVVQKVGDVLCGIGEMSGYLPLQTPPAVTKAHLTALAPRKTLLWCSQDGAPVWVGVLWDLPHDSILSRQLPIRAKTLESLFAKRLLTGALSFASTDVLDIARRLVQYGTSSLLGQNTAVSGLVLSTVESGVTDTWTFGTSDTIAAGVDTYYGTYSDYQAVSDALSSISSADGFEFAFTPVDNGAGGASIVLRLGYPHLGTSSPQVPTLQYPGNVVDYGYPRLGSNSTNQLIGVSTPNGGGATYTSQAPHGVDQADLAAGAPLLQQYVSWPGQGVASQAQINAYVDALLPAVSGDCVIPSVKVRPDQEPMLRQVGLGDTVALAATSELHPANPDGSPGLQLTARITAWDLVPPAQDQPESLTLTLGSLTGYVSTDSA